MARFKLSALEKNWVLYDVANSAFVLLSSSVIPIYFASFAYGNAMVAWGWAETVAALVIALLMPVLGSFADYKGNKIKFFISFFGLGVLACLALSLSTWWLLFLAIYVLASIGLNSSIVFYDAMLVDITDNKRMDNVSSYGYAFGYVGSTIPFIISIALILFGAKIGLTEASATRIAFVITAIWWAVLTIPLVKSYTQKHYKETDPHLLRDTFKELKSGIRKIAGNKAVLFYMISYFFYIDGVHTVIRMATSYGTTLGIDSTQLILALLVTQFVAFPAAIAYGLLATKYNTRLMLSISIVAYFLIVMFAGFFLNTALEFWILAIMVGLFQGGIQSLSRSYFGRMIPKNQSNEFFGFFDLFGKYAAVVGTALVAGITQLTGHSSWGILSVGILFIFGFVFLRMVPDNPADHPESGRETLS